MDPKRHGRCRIRRRRRLVEARGKAEIVIPDNLERHPLLALDAIVGVVEVIVRSFNGKSGGFEPPSVD
ncbi:hypothetical protein U1Q18_010986, partial [Sarracenia purpurea var. burkii]